MMNRLMILTLCLISGAVSGRSQTMQQDTASSMPKLEIPEITIVGKKAITLPFARKGEIYDVNPYQAPPPDSSLLGERLTTAMPVGFMPGDEEKLIPLHASLEGAFGSYSFGTVHGYLDYKKGAWMFNGNTGFASTGGHVDNASGSSFDISAGARSLLSTDNNILKTLQLTLGTSFLTEKYGMIVYPDVERSRKHFTLDASLGSLDRRSFTVDLGIKTNFWNITDSYPFADFERSSVSPTLTSAFCLNVGSVRWSTEISFTSNSLDYYFPTQSVTLFNINSSAQWNVTDKWRASAGIMFANSSDIFGAGRTLALPVTSLEWNLSEQQTFELWWHPLMQLQSYGSWAKRIPYLFPEIWLEPERAPVNIGIGYTATGRTLTVRALFSFTEYTNKAVVGSPMLGSSSLLAFHPNLGYVEATQTRLELGGTFIPMESTDISFTGTLQPTYESGSSEQLPMTPLLMLNGKAKYKVSKLFSASASFDYWSEQNADLAQSRTLDGAFLLNVGASSTIVPRMLLSVSINNLLDVRYDWWADFPAPGLQFLLEAKVNLR